MKNKIFFTGLLFFIFLCFLLWNHNCEIPEYHKVLGVVRADLFYVDINDNSKIDYNELFKLKDVYAFSPELNSFSISNSQKINIDKIDYLKAGYLAQNWAEDNLKGSDIIITSLTKDDTKPYSYITADYNNYDLSRFYLENGLAFANPNSNYSVYQNNKQIRSNANEVSKLDFVLLNLNTNIFHKLNCEFVDLMYSANLILAKHVKNFIPCKTCHVDKESSQTKTSSAEKLALYKSFGNIELCMLLCI